MGGEREDRTRFRSILECLADRKADGGYLRICAPMVRYSKIAFRDLVRRYDCDIAYTPMILSDVFKHSSIARDAEFRTSATDNPVIVQFAAAKSEDLADASELVARHCSGVDLNCGCPQKWAISEGIGCALMEKPDIIKDMVQAVQSRLQSSQIKLSDGSKPTCSIKIRIHDDIKKTMELVKRAEMVGVDYITVHGRTRRMRPTEPVHLDSIKTIKEHAHVPIFANGDVFSLEDANSTAAYTGADGVMAARGLMRNPALFAGFERTPLEAVEEYLSLGISYRTTFFIFHGHIKYMLEDSMSRAEKRRFNILSSTSSVVDYLEQHYGIQYNPRMVQ
ncbi:hypothetical protein DFJ73DRAFT_620008 [Zopfochytrium polystomum]|nr:hypothetical protein DFJ73DRAFT_620008 [Zopfochytrium polystomum]